MTSEPWREGRDSGATNGPQTQSLSGEWREWRVLPTYHMRKFRWLRKPMVKNVNTYGCQRHATRATHARNATPPGALGGTSMEINP